MSSTWKKIRILTAIITVTFVTFLVWLNLRGQSYSTEAPNTPSVQLPITPTGVPVKRLAVNIPQKALWRNYVEVSVETVPGTNCELIYIPPLGKTHQTETMADASGLCKWKWKIDETEGKGNGRLIFTIDGISETHFIEVRSAF